MAEQQGLILRIEKSSIFDGDGLRTVVFFKGCPLCCAWCSTPESQAAEMERSQDKTYGIRLSVRQVMEEIEKDRIFYFHSGGGVTISGGEPLLQADFIRLLLQECKTIGMNTTMETSLCVPYSQIMKVVPYLDTVYADLKYVDGYKHQMYCGYDNKLILENIQKLTAESQPYKVVIRIPMIPGINDCDEDLSEAARFCSRLSWVHAIELLPYHRLGVATYEKLGRVYPLADVIPPSTTYFLERKDFFRKHAAKMNVL